MTLEDLIRVIADKLYLSGQARSKRSAVDAATEIVALLNAGGFLANVKPS